MYPSGAPSSACVDDAAEPDGAPGGAPTLGAGTWSGRRICGADVDTVHVDSPGDAQISATVRYEASQGALALRLVDGSGGTLATGTATDGGTLTAHLAQATSAVYAQVSATDGATRLTYTLELGVDLVQCESDAMEPNDSASAASNVGVGVYPDLRICSGEEDLFRIATTPGQALRFAVAFDARYGDLDLELRGGDGVSVLATAASAKSVEELTHTSPGGGNVYLRVYGVAGARNGYTLTVQDLGSGPDACPSDALGDNRGPDDAVVLFEGVYEGFMVCAGAADWFAVELNGGETLDVLTQAEGAGDPPSVAIYTDPAAAPVVRSGAASDGLAEASYATVGPGWLYYVVETGAAQTGYALLQDVSDPSGACQPDRLEPNGVGDPVALDAGVTTWLRLCGDDDTDAFTLEVPPFTVVTVITGHTAGQGYTDLRLMDLAGVELSAAVDQQDGAYLEVLVEQGGELTLQVEPYQIGVGGLGYDLAVFFD